MPRPIHLVGSIRFENEDEVFRTLGNILGERAPRYPDGETGERHYFIVWQKRVFREHPHIELDEAALSRTPPDVPESHYRAGVEALGKYEIRAGVRAEDVTFDNLGYADEACKSFKTFARLKREGAIPLPTRFLVALPTPTAVITLFATPNGAAQLEPAYERAMLHELGRILDDIPASELAIQWDVMHEVLAHDGAFALHYDDVFENALIRLKRLSEAVPEEVQLGYHLCYGDPGHKHVQEPEDTATSVAFANALAVRVERRIDWVHLPVPRDRDDDAYFKPLTELAMQPATELYLGLLHHTDGIDGTRRRMAVANKFCPEYGIATECGFGRRDPSTMLELLRIHAEIADD